MNSLASGFITLCIVLIAGSLAAVLTITAGFGLAEALAIAMGALVVMVTAHFHILRKRDNDMMTERYEDLTDQVAAMLDDITNFRVRLEETERTIGEKAREVIDKRTRTQVRPLMNEQEILGELVKQMAEAITHLENRLDQMTIDLQQQAERIVEAVPSVPVEAPAPPVSPPSPSAATPAEPQTFVDETPSAEPLPTERQDVVPAPKGEPEAEAAAPQPPGLSAQQIREHIRKNHLTLYLQAIMSLPDRNIAFYEALARFDSNGSSVPASEFIESATASGLVPAIDNLIVYRAAELIERLRERTPKVGIFCNLSPASLVDARFFEGLMTFLDDHLSLTDHLFFEFSQADFEMFGPLEESNLQSLAELGFVFSVDQVDNLQVDFRRYGAHGVRFVKISANTLLTALDNNKADIHPADLAPLLRRFSIDLIVDRIESEDQNVELLDYSAKFGQGLLLAPPKPIRTDPTAAKRGVVDARRRAAQ